MRFALEATSRCADRVGIRLSPFGVFGGMTPDPDVEALYLGLSAELGKLGLAYIHIVDHSAMDAPPLPVGLKAAMKSAFSGTLITSGGYDAAGAESDLAAGVGELVASGRPFISTPNLVEKLRTGAPLAPPDLATFYTQGPEGYIDYPA